MATRTPVARPRRFHDLFYESTDSVSVSWKDGRCVISRGLREGAGVRWLDSSGVVQFRSLDDPTRERISAALGEMGVHEASPCPDMSWSSAWRRRDADGGPAGRRPGGATDWSVTETGECDEGSGSGAPGPPGSSCAPVPIDSKEIDVYLAYLHEAVEGLEAESGDDEARSTAAEIHLYRQRIFHESENGDQTDERGGVRVELRVSSRD